MIDVFKNSRVAIIGGGRVCKDILTIVLNPSFSDLGWHIVGVADLNEREKGLIYAKKNGIYTTDSYQDLFLRGQVDYLIELTGDNELLQSLRRRKPRGVRLIDHFEAVSLWDYLQIETKKRNIKGQLRDIIREDVGLSGPLHTLIEETFTNYTTELSGIISNRTSHLQDVERKLVRRERILSQIIQGSAVPIFVIDKNHVVTHWNKALEVLTGHRAVDLIGTTDHWKAFYAEDQPCLADFIVDKVSKSRIQRYYGKRLRPFSLLKGSYQAEDFFHSLGSSGKSLYFTAAPIRGVDGKIQGAIETLWDMTNERAAKQMLEGLVALQESVLDAIPTAVLVLRRRKIEFANDAVESIFGWSPGELIGKTTSVLYRSEEEYREIGEVFYKALETQR